MPAIEAPGTTMCVERWTCDKCRLASFETFEAADAHEEHCEAFAQQPAPTDEAMERAAALSNEAAATTQANTAAVLKKSAATLAETDPEVLKQQALKKTEHLHAETRRAAQEALLVKRGDTQLAKILVHVSEEALEAVIADPGAVAQAAVDGRLRTKIAEALVEQSGTLSADVSENYGYDTSAPIGSSPPSVGSSFSNEPPAFSTIPLQQAFSTAAHGSSVDSSSVLPNPWDGTSPFASAESLKSNALGEAELRSAAVNVDECLKYTRECDANNTERLFNLSHSLVVALGRLVQIESTDVHDSLLFHNIITQCAKHIEVSEHAAEDAKLDCAESKRLAGERLEELASSFEFSQDINVLKVLEGTGIDKSIIAHGAEILGMDASDLSEGQRHALALMLLLEQYLDADGKVISGRSEAFERETEELKQAYAAFIEARSGKLANCGGKMDGSAQLDVEMNYAYVGCEKYVYLGDALNRMGDPNSGCVGFWLKSSVTLNNRQAGLKDFHSRGPNGGAQNVVMGDRVPFLCSSNKDGDKTDMPTFCNDCGMDELDVHLVKSLLLASHVMRSNMEGKRLPILATGAPVRDMLFEQTEPFVSKYAIFLGCLPHSEMCMQRGFMLFHYDEDQLRQFSKTANLAYSFLGEVTSCMVSRLFEDWTGLTGMTDEMKALWNEALFEIRSRGGSETARLYFLSKAMEAVGNDVDELPLCWLEEYQRFLAKRGYQGDEEKLLRNMAGLGLHVCIALSKMSAALVRTAMAEEECFSSVVLGRLLSEQPELQAELDTLRAHYKDGDDKKIFEAMDAMHGGQKRGMDVCSALNTMSTALQGTAEPKEECFSNVVLRRLLTEQPDLQATWDALRAHYGGDEKIFKALADQHKGLRICIALVQIPAALVCTAEPKEECFSNVVLRRLLTEQPELRPLWDTLRVHYNGTDAAFQAMKAIREEKKQSGKLCTQCCWRYGTVGAFHGMCEPCRKEERETRPNSEELCTKCCKRQQKGYKSHTLCERCRREELNAEKGKADRPAKRRRTGSDESKPPSSQPRFQQIDVRYTTPSLGITVCIDPKTRHVAIRTIKPGAPHCCTLMVGDIVVGINGCQLRVYEDEAHTLKAVVEMLKTTRRPMVVNFYRHR